ncbi:MAG: acyl-CoA dehydrogenase family protein [Panacagrimonas sp.]
MATYQAPIREINFVLNDVLDIGRLAREIPAYADATPEVVLGLVEEAAKLIQDRIAPLSVVGDKQGCVWNNGEVKVPDGFAEAYKLYWQAGWVSLCNPTEFDGQGLPYTLSKVVDEFVSSANVAFSLYPGLTQGCFEAILANGSDAIKQTYLPKLSTGEWTGTMCITEPQAGSDVGAAKTKATPRGDGSYSIDGAKIFITSGEHTMVDNIIHFVLARLPDSPPGVRGLSTFAVPKFLVNADGSLGARNALSCTAIEHKMGINGSCTCAMQFEDAQGWIVGKPNEGIQNMFVMMNLARILVGMQGLGQCELATQNAIRYAADRKQGKAFNGKAEIIEHADVRRMLLQMKATTEGARVLAYETAMYVDMTHHHPDAEAREIAQDWVDLNTPLVKAYCTDSAVDLGSLAIQVYGGHGFIKEHGVEQIARDSKILCLYEGTNGIQAMDLVRRKLMMHNGRLAQRFFTAVRSELNADAPLGWITRTLGRAVDDLESATQFLIESYKTSPDVAGYGAADYQRAFALTYLGFNWLRMVKAVAAHPDEGFRSSKLATAEFFVTRMLPQVHALLGTLRAPTDRIAALEAVNF